MAEKVAKKVMLKRLHGRHVVPVTVWLAAVAAVTWLFYERVQRFEAVGIARGQVRQIAASSTGRIVEIRVPLYVSVQKGQTLAVVDTVTDNEQADEAKLRAQLAAAGAEAERLLGRVDSHAGKAAGGRRQCADEPEGQLAPVRDGCR